MLEYGCNGISKLYEDMAWALRCTDSQCGSRSAHRGKGWAGYSQWRKRWHIENSGFRELKEGWHLERASWRWTDDTVVAARVAFTLLAFNIAQLAKTAQGRQLTDRGIRRLRREMTAQYGPAPVIVFTTDTYAIFCIEEIMTIAGLAPKYLLQRPPPKSLPGLS